jgi:TonB family protein
MRMRIVPSLALIWSSIATPSTSATLQPNTNWDVDYGETQCTAARSFGAPSDPIVLGVVPSIGGETYKLIVSVQRTGPRFAQEYPGTVDFGRDKIKTLMLHYGGKGVKLSAYQYRVSAAEIEQARGATGVGLRSDNGTDFEFSLSEMPALLDALRKCTADLQQYWMGAHPVSSLSKPAKGDLRSVFSGGDYPSEALKRGQGGTAQFQLLINETGRVAGCDVVRESGAPILDAMSCQVIMEKARFSPAIDGNGKPARDVVTTPPIVWKIGTPPQGSDPILTGRPISVEN